MPISTDEFKAVLSRWASGVTVLTVWREGGIHGMTASAFCSVSLNPPLVLVCVDRRARMHGYLTEQASFGVNLLRVGQEEISDRAAGFHGEEGNRLEGVPYRTGHTGAPLLADCLAWLDCAKWRTYDGGDHTIFVGRIEAGGVNEGEPLLWYARGYRRVAGAE